MPATNRLYYADSLLFDFEARVVERAALGNRPSVVLDQSAFYPESGGQMSDRGVLDSADVLDVQLDDAGRVHHVVDSVDALAIGVVVRGRVDGARRRLHMALHTGQHILSRALLDEARAETISSRLGETTCTIDVNVPKLDEARLARVEDLTNSVIDDDVAIRAFFPEASELEKLALRRAPKVDSHVRVVAIGDFDVSPCGGTHATHSAQVGLVRILGVEGYKGGTRVSFAAGRRARRGLASEAGVLGSMAREFSCAPGDVPAAVDKLKRQLTDARETLGLARAELAGRAADELVARAEATGEHTLIQQIDGGTIELLRATATRVTRLPRAVALLAGRTAEGTPVLAVRGADSDFDCGAFVKRAAESSGGRGGGRPERAEGRLPAGVDWNALARSLLNA
jgi:alanyl-tRNA synthetase